MPLCNASRLPQTDVPISECPFLFSLLFLYVHSWEPTWQEVGSGSPSTGHTGVDAIGGNLREKEVLPLVRNPTASCLKGLEAVGELINE